MTDSPTIINPSRWKTALWCLERNDGRGFLTWVDHGNKIQQGGEPDQYVLLFSTDQKAEKYNCEEIKNTGVTVPITINAIEEFAEKCWAAGFYFVMFDFDREREDNKPVRWDDFMQFLRTGQKVG